MLTAQGRILIINHDGRPEVVQRESHHVDIFLFVLIFHGLIDNEVVFRRRLLSKSSL